MLCNNIFSAHNIIYSYNNIHKYMNMLNIWIVVDPNLMHIDVIGNLTCFTNMS